MFIVLLRFSDKTKAGPLMEGHKAWLTRGYDEGVFLLSGSLQPAVGGGILAQDTSRSALEARVAADPFVAEGVVSAEILELTASQADPRLQFLVG